MATKYQSEKVIEKLSSREAQNPNIQGYGIGRAKDHGKPDEKGYVVITYVARLKDVQAEQSAEPEPAPETKPEPKKRKAIKKPVKKRAIKAASKKVEIPDPEPVDYPQQVKTTSRKKSITVQVAYVETGEFGFE